MNPTPITDKKQVDYYPICEREALQWVKGKTVNPILDMLQRAAGNLFETTDPDPI